LIIRGNGPPREGPNGLMVTLPTNTDRKPSVHVDFSKGAQIGHK
jgi:hypothetical protein